MAQATTAAPRSKPAAPSRHPAEPERITSVDAARGLVMFAMIFVNDLAGASDKIVPPWMKHFRGQNGMTFVDLVFPAFLFIVGMSIPLAMRARTAKGEHWLKTLWHVLLRTVSLLFIGILMVNGTPDAGQMGWSGGLWTTLMYTCAILAFCDLSSGATASAAKRAGLLRNLSRGLRIFGLAALIALAFVYRGSDGHRIISLSPLSIHTEWYGILGLIGWAYLVGCIVYLLFGKNRTALLACAVLLMCLYPADRAGAFEHFWVARYVGIGATLGSHAAITVLGILLAAALIDPDLNSVAARTKFALLFIAGCAAAALLVHGLYGINKNQATPSWCLWACAITAILWLLLYLGSETAGSSLVSSLAVAGRNVFLAYLISDLWPSLIDWLGLWNWYGHLAGPTLANAIARSAGCGLVIMAMTLGLTRVGFRVRL